MATTSFQSSLATLTVANGATNSSTLDSSTFSDAVALAIFASSAATAGVFQFSPDSGVTWYNIQDATATDYTTPLAGKVRVYTALVIPKGLFRITMAVASVGITSYIITKVFTS